MDGYHMRALQGCLKQGVFEAKVGVHGVVQVNAPIFAANILRNEKMDGYNESTAGVCKARVEGARIHANVNAQFFAANVHGVCT